MMDVDQDEVVQEMDVYLNGKIGEGNLYVLSYENRRPGQNFNDNDIISSRIKPKNHMLEITESMDITSNNYDEETGHKIAQKVDLGDGSVYKSALMDKKTYTSTLMKTPKGAQYMLAVIEDGHLTLNPVKEMLRMTPSFDYMNEGERRRLEQLKRQKADEVLDGALTALRPVNIRAAGNDTEAAKQARERSRDELEKRVSAEQWIPLRTVVDGKTREVKDVRDKLHYPADPDHLEELRKQTEELAIPGADYIDMISPKVTESPSYNNHNGGEEAKSDSAKLETLLKDILCNAKIVRFKDVEEIVKERGFKDGKDLVRMMQKQADIVRGCFVVKSKVLYPDKSMSALDGLASEDICNLRDFIISCFSVHTHVDRNLLCQTLGDYSPLEINKVLNEVARYTDCGWELRYDDDLDFMNAYTSSCERSNLLWKAKMDNLKKTLSIDNTLYLSIGGGRVDNNNGNSKPEHTNTVVDVPAICVKQERTESSMAMPMQCSREPKHPLRPVKSEPVDSLVPATRCIKQEKPS